MNYMKTKAPFQITGFAIAVIFLLNVLPSCEYEFIEIDVPVIEDTVKFSVEILPIFNTNNNCTGCHRAGATSPDFTEQAAYNSIVPLLVNLADPESSKIYQFPLSSSPSHGFKKYTPAQAALILAWIKQGAPNN